MVILEISTRTQHAYHCDLHCSRSLIQRLMRPRLAKKATHGTGKEHDFFRKRCMSVTERAGAHRDKSAYVHAAQWIELAESFLVMCAGRWEPFARPRSNHSTLLHSETAANVSQLGRARSHTGLTRTEFALAVYAAHLLAKAVPPH